MIKKLCLLFFIGCNIVSAQNDRYNLQVLSHFNDTTIKRVDGDQIWSDVMGWKDTVKNKEYMIAGSPDSIFFFDITNPTTLIKCDVEFGHSRNAVNRDYDVYDHYIYCVSDRTSPLGALQIFDMQYLPDSVHKVYDNDTFSISTHTLFIEAKTKRLYLCGNTHKPAGIRSMAILSIENPEIPTFLGELDKSKGCSYTHEVFVQNDTAFCSCGNDGLYIYDLTNPIQTSLISSINNAYPGRGYNHSSWLDSTNRYVMFTDENQGSPIKVYDLKQFGSPDLVTYFNSNTNALPHNAYWKGRYAYASMYEDGVYIFDMTNITNELAPTVAGYFDTYPLNNPGIYNGFHGCWGVWPFLPSGVILASDISEGLFVLKPEWTLGVNDSKKDFIKTSISPNPFNGKFTLSIQSLITTDARILIHNMQGQLLFEKNIIVSQGENEIEIQPLLSIPVGLHQLSLLSKQTIIHKPILKIN